MCWIGVSTYLGFKCNMVCRQQLTMRPFLWLEIPLTFQRENLYVHPLLHPFNILKDTSVTHAHSISLLTSHNTCEKVPTITSTVANRDPPTLPPRAELSSSPSTILSSAAVAVPTPKPRPPAVTTLPSEGEPREMLPFFRGLPSIRVRKCSSDRRCPSPRASSNPLQKSVEQHSSGCKW